MEGNRARQSLYKENAFLDITWKRVKSRRIIYCCGGDVDDEVYGMADLPYTPPHPLATIKCTRKSFKHIK